MTANPPRAHWLGDNIDTDMIIAGRHLGSTDPAYLAQHCLAAHMPDFSQTVSPGDVLFAGWNFGCGSSRETAALALKATGLRCVVAKSFARIYFRSSVNIGFPALVCPEAVDAVRQGDSVEIDFETSTIMLGDHRRFMAEPLPAHVLRIVEAGGLVPLMSKRLGGA